MSGINKRYKAALKELEKSVKEVERLSKLVRASEHMEILESVVLKQGLLLDRLEKLNEK